MPNIADLRKQYKSLETLTDYEIVDHYAQQNGVSFETIAMDLGVPLPNKPGFGTSVKNSMYGLAQGLGQLGGDFAPGVENNNALEVYGRGGTQRNPVDIMDGEGGAFSNLADNLTSRPMNTVGQIAGQAVGLAIPGGALKLGTTAYRGLRGLEALGAVGKTAQATGEAALYGTTSYGSMRDQQEAQGDNTGEDKLKALLSAGAIGGIERFAGLEGLIAGRAGAASTLGKSILRQGAGEAGEEVLQTPIEKFGANQEVLNMDTLDQAAAGGLAGFIGGGLAGPLAHQLGKKKELLGTANTTQEDKSQESILGLPNRPNDTMISFPDGSTGTQEQVDAYLKTLPEEQQVMARARLSGLNDFELPKNADSSEVAATETAKNEQPAWDLVDPDTQTILPEPKDVVGKGKKKTEAYTLVAQARSSGAINQTQFEDFTNQIATTNKIGKVLPKIFAELGEINANMQKVQESELQVQRQTEGVQEAAPAVQEEGVGQVDLAKIAAQLAPQQRKIFDALVTATQNNETDQIISGDGKLQYQAIATRAGLEKRGAAQSAINQTIKKISNLAGIDVKQFLADRTQQVRRTEPAVQEQLGLSPSVQGSFVEAANIFGDEDSTASMGMIKSVGATDTDQGSVVSNNNRAQDAVQAQGTEILEQAGALNRGDVIVPDGDVTPSENAIRAAELEKEAHKQFLLDHPEARNAMNDWDHDSVQLSDFDETDMIDYLSDYIETVTSDEFGELSSQHQIRVIEDLQVPIAQNIKRRLFNESGKNKAAVGANKTGRPKLNDAGAVRQMAISANVAGHDRQNIGSSEQRREGAQTIAERANGARGSESESQVETASIAAAEVLDTGLASRGKALTSAQMREGAVGDGFEAFYAHGFGPILLNMKEITVKSINSDGLFDTTDDGRFTITLNDKLVVSNDKFQIAHVVRHELSHAIDWEYGFAFSQNEKMDLSYENGKIKFIGPIAKEIEAMYIKANNGKRHPLAQYFDYPLDLSKLTAKELKNLKSGVIRAEIFAQLQAAWMTKEGAQVIRTFLPKTAQYLTEVNIYAKNNLQTNDARATGADAKNPRKFAGGTGTVFGNNQAPAQRGSGQETEFQTGLASRGLTLNTNGNDFLDRAQSAGTDAWQKINHAVKSLSPKLLTSTQLVEQYGNKISSLKTYIKSQNEMGAMASQLREASSKLLEVWGTYAFKHKVQNTTLMSVMHDATQAEIHPDAAFNDEVNSHLTADTLQDYNKLSARYNALPEDAKALYQNAKQLLSNNWKLRQEIYADVVNSAYDPRIEEALKNNDTKTAASLTRTRDSDIKEHAKQIKELKGPYFPLLRFGDYVVIAESEDLLALRKEMEEATPDRFKELSKQAADLEKSGKHYVVEAFESRLEMEKRKTDLSAKGFQTRERKAETYSQETRPVTAAALERINDSLTTGFDKATANKLKDLVTEMYVAALPEHHALQRQIKRKGVAGADANMMRAFAETVERDSFYLSRMKYAKELTKSLMDMRKETHGMTVDEQNVYNNVVDRATADYKYEHTPILSALARVSSIFHLGISPAFLLTNMTQPWFISVPQLAGAHGATKTFAAMRSGWVDAAKIIKQGKGGTLFNLADVDLSVITNPNERKMLERLRDVNKLDSTQLLDMGALSNGMKPIEMKGWKVFNWATHHIELTNRISTALATYRLEQARNPNASQESLIDKAINMVDLTQLDYSNENAAYFMKPGVGFGKLNKIIFQFRKYQQGMIYLLGRNAKLAFAGDKEAGRALGYLMGTQLLFAGTTGLPITAPLLFAAYGLAGDDDDEKGDLETKIRNYATDVLGPDAARVFWKGLPSALGADISSNIGMGGLFKPFPMMASRDITEAKTGEDAIKEVLFNAAGAPVGMISDMAEGVISFKNGEYARGISRMTPRFVASVIKAKDLSDNGLATRSGTQVMTADQFDGWDIAIKAAGFNPSAVSEHYTAQSSKENTSRAIQDRRNRLLQQYAVAKIKGEDLTDIRAEISLFNGDHPKVKLDQSALIRAVQTRKKASSETNEVGVRFRKNEASLEGIDRFAY